MCETNEKDNTRTYVQEFPQAQLMKAYKCEKKTKHTFTLKNTKKELWKWEIGRVQNYKTIPNYLNNKQQ